MLYEDPDGHIMLPNSLTAQCWKRPSEYLLDQVVTLCVGSLCSYAAYEFAIYTLIVQSCDDAIYISYQ